MDPFDVTFTAAIASTEKRLESTDNGEGKLCFKTAVDRTVKCIALNDKFVRSHPLETAMENQISDCMEK